MSGSNAKRDARNAAKLALAKLSPEEIAERSRLACGHLLDRWPEPKAVIAYLALPQEADPAGAMAVWRARGVTVCVPRTDWDRRTMEPAVLGDRVIEGERGIRTAEPGQPTVELDSLNLVVVPGLSFTRDGRRLGRGAGFYDRFLRRVPAWVETVGLALSPQIAEDVPTEPHDHPVRWLATEDGVAGCRPRQHDPEGV
ncbi:MAG: 5-formyltetrahydrofolate cyclo-ligase [Planctomycetota bacterium]